MDRRDILRVAAIQAAPVFLDRDASLEKAVRLIAEAGEKGVMLAAFSEAWLGGYPTHASANASHPDWHAIAATYLDQAINVPGPETDALCAAAREAGLDLVIGVSERDPITQGTVYATLLMIGSDGTVLGRHRKLRPTMHERIVWGDGDGVDLRVHDRGYGHVSALNSGEHQMVLPTYALAEQGTQIHVAAWPGGEPADGRALPGQPRQHLLSRAFAAQAGAYVVCAGGLLTRSALHPKYQPFIGGDFTGDSIIVDPLGDVIAGPASGETILVADCSLARIRAAKVGFDCAGHSARRDQLKLMTPAIEAHDSAMEQNDGSGFNGGGGSMDGQQG